ncbi:hypothetical protein FHR92_004724 [Fontibacillus solani]|uniref:Uncharacterized protein n=1 Tax=Fontibacillus solani TaxID=1572857 RepID=A0A7W3SY21_9BACL|nr:DUF6508 domain-containing protein [Fontibacillus solani]MBA9088228.1 hypothetical protein [Fontibacillus solani]
MVVNSQYDTLIQFIDYFQNETIVYCTWQPTVKSESGTYTLGYPIYDDRLLMFIKAVNDSGITVQDYRSKLNGIFDKKEPIKMIDNMNDLITVKAMLTYYVRAERFGDGSWAFAAENMVFLRILIKLKE